MTRIICPECDYFFRVSPHVNVGQQIICPECDIRLTLVNLNPVEVDTALPTMELKQKATTIEIACPECDHLLKLRAHIRQGQRVTCSHCSTDLVENLKDFPWPNFVWHEVIRVKPIELDMAMPKILRARQNRHHKLETRAGARKRQPQAEPQRRPRRELRRRREILERETS